MKLGGVERAELLLDEETISFEKLAFDPPEAREWHQPLDDDVVHVGLRPTACRTECLR